MPTVAGDAKAPELDAAIDFSSCILPAGGTLATHKGADQSFRDDMTEIMPECLGQRGVAGWIDSILLNRFEIYGEDAANFIDDACEKALTADDNLK